MKRLIIAGLLAAALAGFGAGSAHATNPNNGPTYIVTPKPAAPCASNMTSAKAAAAGAQDVLTVDHHDAHISATQLKALSGDLTSDAKSAEQKGDWGGLCKDISTIESEAKAE